MPGQQGIDQEGGQATHDAEQGDGEGDDQPGDHAFVLHAAKEQDEGGAAGGRAAQPGEGNRRVQSQETVPQPGQMSLQQAPLSLILARLEQVRGMLRVIGNAGQTGVENIQQRARTGQQKDRRESDLHDVRGAVDRVARGNWEEGQDLYDLPAQTAVGPAGMAFSRMTFAPLFACFQCHGRSTVKRALRLAPDTATKPREKDYV